MRQTRAHDQELNTMLGGFPLAQVLGGPTGSYWVLLGCYLQGTVLLLR